MDPGIFLDSPLRLNVLKIKCGKAFILISPPDG